MVWLKEKSGKKRRGWRSKLSWFISLFLRLLCSSDTIDLFIWRVILLRLIGGEKHVIRLMSLERKDSDKREKTKKRRRMSIAWSVLFRCVCSFWLSFERPFWLHKSNQSWKKTNENSSSQGDPGLRFPIHFLLSCCTLLSQTLFLAAFRDHSIAKHMESLAIEKWIVPKST